MKKSTLTIISLLLFTSLSARNFTGKIWYSKPGGATEPLPFAQVYWLEQKILADADENGVFTLDINHPATLVATYVGYTRDTVVVNEGMMSADFFLTGENDIEQAVVTGRQAGLSKLKPIRTEVITAAGLCKMACCALAESFENSASVTVGYSDAVTGARQIKLLGLSGTYTQMLDENRPVMRGIASPFGMSFVPGQWLESIQIAKGPSSVINGLEAITGQINMEHRKPTDETPLFIQLYGSLDKMFEANVASALQINPKWSVINMAHVGGSVSNMDHNKDGFRDEPEDFKTLFTTRWLYYAPSGVQVRFGGRFIYDNRLGGQTGYRSRLSSSSGNTYWGSEIKNRGVNGYLKVGIPLNTENSANIALVADYTYHEMDALFGLQEYGGTQHSVFANLIYQNEINERHKIEAGLTSHYDRTDETVHGAFWKKDLFRNEPAFAAFGEYTFTLEDKLTFVGGVNLEYNCNYGWLFAPRANVKYCVTDNIVLRALGGRGYRTAGIFTDNLGIFSTNYKVVTAPHLDLLEDAWTFGGNATFYLPFGVGEDNTYISLDYFRNSFNKQVIVDPEVVNNTYSIYNLDGRSFTNTWQLDFNVEPVERFTITATARYTQAKVNLQNQGLVERPMTSRFKGVLNLQYATAMNRWTFDFTAQLNGAMKLPSFAVRRWDRDESPVYPMLFAQITRKFRGIDVYVGGENLTNFRQKDAIIDAQFPFSHSFNASCVWGPLMGIKVYAGLRYTLWKM